MIYNVMIEKIQTTYQQTSDWKWLIKKLSLILKTGQKGITLDNISQRNGF